jgi:hypothetical protein
MAMFPFMVDKNWFEKHWHDNQRRPKRKLLATGPTRLTFCILLLAGGAVVANQLRSSDRAGETPVKHTGSLME